MAANPLRFSVTGDKEMMARIRAIAAAQPARIARALYRQGEKIMAISKAEFVPVDKGTLRGTGVVLPPTGSGVTTSVTLQYGDASTPYALAVHEHLSEHSPRSWKAAEAAGRRVDFGGRGPKYLEAPLMEAAPYLADDLAEDLRLK